MKPTKALFTLLLSSIVLSCRPGLESSNGKEYSQSYKDAFIEDFKTLSFCKCVEYGNKQKIDDVSCRYPDYLYGEAKAINNLAKLESDKIQLDSIERRGRVAEGMEGKRVMGMCLEFYKSKELDSIAKSRFKKASRQ